MTNGNIMNNTIAIIVQNPETNQKENEKSTRLNVLTSLNWKSIFTRSTTLFVFVLGIATYMASPQLGSLENLGVRKMIHSRDSS